MHFDVGEEVMMVVAHGLFMDGLSMKECYMEQGVD